MTTLLALLGISAFGIVVLLALGIRRAKFTPVSYEFDWHPQLWVSTTLVPEGRWIWARMKVSFERGLHRLFHSVFHRMKAFHDRIFGKQIAVETGAPSFFLKTIAEHKEETSEERKRGLS